MKKTKLNPATELRIDLRRSAIANMMVRNRRITVRMIEQQLATMTVVSDGQEIAIGVNPRTKKPYSRGTVHSDIQAIRDRAREQSDKSAQEWLDEENQALDALETWAWRNQKGELILKINESRRELNGYGSADRIELTGAGGGPVQMEDVSDDEKVNRIAVLLAAALERRNGQAKEPRPVDQ